MLFRTVSILFVLFPFLLSIVRDHRRFFLFGGPRPLDDAQHLARAQKLRIAANRLGPAFIKLAQILGARADLLPEVYVEQFAMLHDRVAPIPAEQIRKVIRAELGRPVEELFADFDDTPIAAASLGQVHRARLDGEEVVVKVIRPGVRAKVRQDIRIVRRLLAGIALLFDNALIHSLRNIVAEFSRIIVEEMDLRQEARYAEVFRENFRDSSILIIPEIYPDLTTRSVLVLKYYDGTKVTELDDTAPDHAVVRTVIDQLMEIYAQQILVDGLFHADPHPGNILVQDDGRIVLLDFGMVVRLDEKTRKQLLRTTIAWAGRDIDALIESLYDLGVIDPEINFSVVAEVATELIDIIDRNRYTQRKIRVVCNEVLSTFYRFPLRLPSQVVYLFKTAILIEGLGVKYDPTFDGGKAATPVIRRMMKTILPDPHETALEFVKERTKDLLRFGKATQRVMTKAAREELRVRAHPQDVRRLEAYAVAVMRRIILSVFVLSIPIIVAIIYHKTGEPKLLYASVGLVVVLLIPILLWPIRPRKRF